MEEENINEELDQNESPRDRFKRLAGHRTNEILKRLKILGNCANKRNYHYDQNDILKIFGEIEKRVRETKAKFLGTDEQEFKV